MMSATGIVGPLMMTSIFAYFTHAEAGIYFPGAPFIAGAILIVVALVLILRKGEAGTLGTPADSSVS
jgi:DHA1 family tetracycline resistance protein-like MFS transporter